MGDFPWCKQVFDLPIYSKMSNNSSRQPSTNNFLMLQDKIETQKGENKILRQKLQSKSEALVILSQELDKVRNEYEDYRELTRRLQTQWSLLSSDLGGPSHVSLFNSSKVSELRDHPFKTSANSHTFLTPTPLPSAVF